MLQGSIGNQATLRYLTQRPSNLPAQDPAERHEQGAAPENMTARETSRGPSWDFSKIPVFSPDRATRPQASSALAATPLPGAIQAKLVVGEVNDPLEHEAGRVADRVMRMRAPTPAVTAAPLRVNRKLAQGEAEADGLVQPKSVEAGVDAVALAPAIVHDVVQSPGRRLDPATRDFFEPRFGYDLSSVRVHTDARADASAQAVNANAYTVGQNIVFGAGRFAPHQSDGRKLLAHELAHVVQQRRPEAAGAGQDNCEQDAENAAHSIGGEITPVVRTGAVFGTVQRQPKGPAAQKESRLVRVERYWRSTSARAFFADGSNEEVTFVDTSKLDGSSRPEGTFETVLNLTVDWSSTIRPHVDLASGTSGTNVKVVTRLSPADRISKLPTKVRAEVSEAFLGDTENESSPEMMEFAADMGDRLKETSGTTKIEMEGRDPATVATMKTVDQWVSDQKSSLDKVGTMHRGKFAHLLNDIRQVGVTGPAKAEDLDAQDIELVLAGAAGGQSEFQTFDEFKRGMNFKLRTGRTSIPEENADNPDFYIRNEYRRAWKAEAAGLRKMSRIAAAAQAAPFIAIGASAAAGGALIGLEALGIGVANWAAARGVSARLLAKYAGASLFAGTTVNQFTSARDEAKAAGMDPNSPSGIANTASVALLRASGLGEVKENIENRSMLTGQYLNRSTFERITGGVAGTANVFGTFGTFVPEAPSVPAATAPHPPVPDLAISPEPPQPHVEVRTPSTPHFGEPAYSANPRPASATRPMKALPGDARRGAMGGGPGTPVAYPRSHPTVEVRTPSTPDLGKPDYSVTPQTPGPDPWGAAPRPTRPPTPRAPPGHHARTAQAAQEAQAMGLEDLQKGRLGMHEHKTAPAVREATGTAGKGYESTHVVPQAVYRAIGANPDNALALNLPKSLNTAIDAGWKPNWERAFKLGKQITGADVRNWVGQSIQDVPENLLSKAAKGALEERLDVELRGLGITANTVVVPGIR